MNKIINLVSYFISMASLMVFFLLYILLKVDVPTSAWFIYPSFIHFVPSILAGTLLIIYILFKAIFIKKITSLDLLNILTIILISLLISFINEIYLLFGTNAQIMLLSFTLVYIGLYSFTFLFLNRKVFLIK